jgi:predicted Zn-ribbon and HTH transcriptional regulator
MFNIFNNLGFCIGWMVWLVILLIIQVYYAIKSHNSIHSVISLFLVFAIIMHTFTIKNAVENKSEKIVKIENVENHKTLHSERIYIHCKKCGMNLLKEGEFCTKCGYKFDINDFNPKKDVIMYRCPNCKGLCTTKEKFCEDCGKNITDISNEFLNNFSR